VSYFLLHVGASDHVSPLGPSDNRIHPRHDGYSLDCHKLFPHLILGEAASSWQSWVQTPNVNNHHAPHTSVVS
jgi:hypothetical protein